MASFISKIRNRLAFALIDKSVPMSIDQSMQKAIFQWQGKEGIIYPADQKSYIDNGYNVNIFVYSVVNYITSKASVLPWILKEKLPDGSSKVIKEHELINLIKNPNNMYSFEEYLAQSLGYLLLTGNSYDYTVRVGAGKTRVKEIYYLPSQYIDIVSSGSWVNPILKYDFSLYKDLSFDAKEVMHTKLPNYDFANGESLYGMSPIRAALRNIEMSNENITAMKSQSANQGARGLLMFDDSTGMDITEPQMRSFEREMKRKVNSGDKRGTVQLMDRMFKYQQLGMTSKDLELIGNHQVSKQDISMLYQLSSKLFNDNEATTYNNMAEAKKSAYTDSILPYLQMKVNDFNYNITSLYSDKLYFEVDTSGVDVLQVDRKEQAEWLGKAYWISTQRKQEIMGEKADNSLPSYLLPTSLVPSDEIEINNAFNDYEQGQV